MNKYLWLFVLPLMMQAQIAEFGALSNSVVFPKGAHVSVAPTGEYLVDGRPRYLFGVQISGNSQANHFAHTSGYGPEYNWVYDEPLGYESSQRLGFDTFAVFLPREPWFARHGKEDSKWGWNQPNIEFFNRFTGNGLPMLLDVTCFAWSFGLFGTDKAFLGKVIPREAAILAEDGGSNHMMAYNPLHPEGRRMYLDYWKYGCEFARSHMAQNQPLIFELLNEPAYDAPSPYNRGLFREYLKAKYGDIDTLNKTWRTGYKDFQEVIAFTNHWDVPPLNVDWSKFLEEAMTRLAVDGRREVRSLLPDTLVCYQILGGSSYWWLPNTHINIYEISRRMDAISTPTGGGLVSNTGLTVPPERTVEAPANPPVIGEGLIQRHFLRTLAGNKPLHNPECYAPASRHGKYLTLWLDYLRGADATYMFCWGKRAWEWSPKGTPEGGRAMAQKFGYSLANPYAHATESLPGFMDAKKEINELSDFFGYRANRPRSDVALMFSYATARYAEKSDYVDAYEMYGYASALEFSHIPYDVIVEEQLPEAVLKKYRVLVSVGTRNTLPTTGPELEAFVRAGGVVFAARQAMPWDEYGNEQPKGIFAGLSVKPAEGSVLAPLKMEGITGRIMAKHTSRLAVTDDWQILATCADTPALVKRSLGKGFVYFMVPSLQDHALSAVLDGVLAQHGCSPQTRIDRKRQGDMEPNIEVHTAKSNGMLAMSLINLDAYPKLSVVSVAGEVVYDVRNHRRLPVAEGKTTVFFPANGHVILATGTQEALSRRFGDYETVTEEFVEEAYTQSLAAHEKQYAVNTSRECRYFVDAAQTVPLDLRRFVNTGFEDDNTGGNGQGGWLDLGRKEALANTPWEVVNLLGVPCDFIRHDMNNEKACIVLKSKSCKMDYPAEIKGIPVDGQVLSLYFFAGAAGGRAGERALTAVVHYDDGSQAEVPMACGAEIDDWTLPESARTSRRIAWQNNQGRGFYVHCWRNPVPEKLVKSVDLVSGNGDATPFVVGITAEHVKPGMAVYPAVMDMFRFWGNNAVVSEDGVVTCSITESTSDWAGVRIALGRHIKLTNKQMQDGELVFEMNGGADPFGNHKGGQKLQIKCPTAYVRIPLNIDGDANTFQEVRVPLQRWRDKSTAPEFEIKEVSFQFVGTGKTAGYQLRNVRIEVPQLAP